MSVDIHALSGAYAVDAVDEFERAQFERHLSGCAACRAEVDSLREAASLIAETSARPAPDSLRESVLAGVQSVRPLPPVVIAAAERGRSTRRRFPALVAAAAALVVIGGAGATVWHPWSDERGTDRPGITEVADAQTFTTEFDGGSMTLVRSKSLNQALLTTEGLPPLPSGKTYELWLIHDGTFVKAGLMDGDATSVYLEGDPASATGAGITIEDEGGTDKPSLGNVVTSVQFKQA